MEQTAEQLVWRHQLPIDEVEVGDKVKSHDFPVIHEAGRECYVEGVVEEIKEYQGCLRYKVKATGRYFGGEPTDQYEDYYYPPKNGLNDWLGKKVNQVEVVQ